jgi:anti-sigma factor RsiW
MKADEEVLHALVDGRLGAEQAAALRQRLAGDAEARATFEAWNSQRESLRRLHRGALAEPVPASLLATAARAAGVHARSSRWQSGAAVAASLALAFGGGWLAHAQWPGAASSVVAAAPLRSFAHEAVMAHVVYLPEVRHPVEVAADQQDHLVQWLSKRLGRPLKVPKLTEQGYELVGGRLLPGDEGARAQFMFQNAAGNRVTLYIGAVRSAGADRAKDTAFSFSSDGPVPGFYWVDQGYGFALAGKLSREALMDLAKVVYQQL